MTYMKSTAIPAAVSESRINARLDAQAAAQLDYLVATTGLGVSGVVRASLAHFYQAQRAGQVTSLKHLMPLVGRFHSGHCGTSAQVKQVVAQYLDARRGAAADTPDGAS